MLHPTKPNSKMKTRRSASQLLYFPITLLKSIDYGRAAARP